MLTTVSQLLDCPGPQTSLPPGLPLPCSTSIYVLTSGTVYPSYCHILNLHRQICSTHKYICSSYAISLILNNSFFFSFSNALQFLLKFCIFLNSVVEPSLFLIGSGYAEYCNPFSSVSYCRLKTIVLKAF